MTTSIPKRTIGGDPAKDMTAPSLERSIRYEPTYIIFSSSTRQRTTAAPASRAFSRCCTYMPTDRCVQCNAYLHIYTPSTPLARARAPRTVLDRPRHTVRASPMLSVESRLKQPSPGWR